MVSTPLQVHVTGCSLVKVWPHDPVVVLMRAVEKQTDIPPAEQILVHNGKTLEPSKRLFTYGLRHGSGVQLTGRLRGGMAGDEDDWFPAIGDNPEAEFTEGPFAEGPPADPPNTITEGPPADREDAIAEGPLADLEDTLAEGPPADLEDTIAEGPPADLENAIAQHLADLEDTLAEGLPANLENAIAQGPPADPQDVLQVARLDGHGSS